MDVEIVTPESILYSGDAEMVIARSTAGELGVMKDHEPMIVSLAYGELKLYHGDQVGERFAVYGGFLEMRHNVVSVLTDDAEPVEDIDPGKALHELRELESVAAADDFAKAAVERARMRVTLSER